MNYNEMKSDLSKAVCNVKFTKVNGEFRDMLCTLNDGYIPKEAHPKVKNDDIDKNVDVIRVYDVTAQGWRSFKVDSVKDFVVLMPMP